LARLRGAVATAGAAAVLALAAAMPGCGGDCRVLLTGGLSVACEEQPPGPGDPAFGSFGEIFVEGGGGMRMWVGMGDAAAAGDLQALCAGPAFFWIVGVVVVASDRRDGFFFDPETVRALASVGEEMQTEIERIAADPPAFAARGGGRGWAVPARIVAAEGLPGLLAPCGWERTGLGS
jgi:hypothetical protein